MTHPLIVEIEKEQMKPDVPGVRVGDTVKISSLIREGKKERLQAFEGVVVRRTKIRTRDTVVLRKIVDKVAVEKSFLVHSPLVKTIEITQRGKVRRARLNYLRERIGIKANRIKSAD